MPDKFKIIVLMCLLGLCFDLPALTVSDQLETADSLYRAQKYTDALDYYESIYEHDIATPAMLAKMAFIKEGLGDYVSALYYLNRYYSLTHDKNVLIKMREIAAEHELTGFEYSDSEFLINIFSRYSNQILLISVFIGLILTLTIFILKKEGKIKLGFGVVPVQLFFLIMALIVGNKAFRNDYGLIRENNTLLKSGPSAGAEPMGVVSKGHRVVVLDQDEVWSKIRWEDQEAFVRNSRIRQL